MNIVKLYIKEIVMAFLFFVGIFIGYSYEHNKFIKYQNNELNDYNNKLNDIIKSNKEQSDKDKLLVEELNKTITNLKESNNNNYNDLNELLDKNKSRSSCVLSESELYILNKTINKQ